MQAREKHKKLQDNDDSNWLNGFSEVFLDQFSTIRCAAYTHIERYVFFIFDTRLGVSLESIRYDTIAQALLNGFINIHATDLNYFIFQVTKVKSI